MPTIETERPQTNEAEDAGGDPSAPGPWRSAALATLDAAQRWHHDPLWLPADAGADEPPLSLRRWAEDAIRRLEEDGEGVFEIVSAHLDLLARAACAELARTDGEEPTETAGAAILAAAAQRFAAGLDLSDAARSVLDGELERLLDRAPRDGRWLRLDDPQTLDQLYLHALERSRAAARAQRAAEVDAVIRSLAERLEADRALDPAANAPDALRARLGAAAAPIDAARLSAQLPGRRGPQRLDDELRRRMEEDLATLRAYRRAEPEPPRVIRLHGDDGPSLADAVDLFDRRAAAESEVLVALRRARLALRDAYDPEVHEVAFRRFDWRSFSAEELRCVPPVAVRTDTSAWRGSDAESHPIGPLGDLGSLSSLIRAGRPIHVLLADDGTPATGRAFDPGIGYLAMAHREVFVVQSSLSTPDHLFPGLARLVESPRPAVAVVGVPPAAHADAADPWIALEARRLGRDLPVYVYDPARGETWAERFDLDGNPAPGEAWPTVGDAGSEHAFTYADAALLDPAWGEQLRPAEDENDAGQDPPLPLVEFLELADPDARARRRAFVPRAEADGGGRLLVGHELAFACSDRRHAWRLLQELAGTDNEHARRAARAARDAAEAEAEEERRRLRAIHAAELEAIRREAAGEAIDRLVAVLTGSAAPPADGTAATMPAAESPGDTQSGPRRELDRERHGSPTEETAGAEDRQETAAPATDGDHPLEEADGKEFDEHFEEPWVDSVLCTSCDDCIRVNAQLFRYNAEKQVEIADPDAGTFEELVRAAEACPARCIHPGTPRPGDPTADDDLIERARAYR